MRRRSGNHGEIHGLLLPWSGGAGIPYRGVKIFLAGGSWWLIWEAWGIRFLIQMGYRRVVPVFLFHGPLK